MITLDESVREGDSVSITYFPSGGTIRIRDDDAGRNRAQINSYSLTNLTDYAPILKSAEVDGATLTVTFDQALDAAAEPAASAYSLSSNGPSIATSSISDSILTLTLAQTATEDVDYEFSYTPPETGGLRDTTDNLVAAITDEQVENETDYAPTPAEVTTDVDGTYVDLHFDQSLDLSVGIPNGWFNVGPATENIEVESVDNLPHQPNNNQLRIYLNEDTPIREGATVTLTYDQPLTGGLQDDDAGNQVVGFTISVTNNVDVAPLVEKVTAIGRVLTIDFDQPLHDDADDLPPPSCEKLKEEEEDPRDRLRASPGRIHLVRQCIEKRGWLCSDQHSHRIVDGDRHTTARCSALAEDDEVPQSSINR